MLGCRPRYRARMCTGSARFPQSNGGRSGSCGRLRHGVFGAGSRIFVHMWGRGMIVTSVVFATAFGDSECASSWRRYCRELVDDSC